MSRVAPKLYEICQVANSGRGVIALQHIKAGTVILESGPSAFHVIFRTYGKETCANCFLWDRGRSLPVRDNDIAKAFCSSDCQSKWLEEQGARGVESWRCLASFARDKGKGTSVDEMMGDGPKPSKHTIDTEWAEIDVQSKELRRLRQSIEPSTKAERRRAHALQRKILESIDVDTLSYLLSGTIFYNRYRDKWHHDIMELAMDEQPYRTFKELAVGCSSYLQLLSILPVDLLDSLTADMCLNIVRADNHNAFGIRAGESGEEYMGYGVYPCASYFNHSCNPNLDKRRLGNSWEFTAARDIAPGEQCCISYLGGEEKDMSRLERQSRLLEAWSFTCSCQRCLAEAEYT